MITDLSRVVKPLRRIVGPDWVKDRTSELDTYSSDGLPTLTRRPGLVVIPAGADEVKRVVALLADHQIPFVARGAGTGLSGGSLAGADAVLISLTRLNRILEIDAGDRIAVVEPGVVNARLSEAAAPYGLHYAPDPSSQTACTIGGNVAENAGGPHCLKYGVTTNHILDLEIVLPSGDTVALGSRSGVPFGPDLVGAFVGSEGMFGIALEVTVKLVPTPAHVITLLADFDSIAAAGETVSRIIASGIVPSALEMIDRNCIRAVEESIYAAGFPTDAAAILLIEVDGEFQRSVEDEAKGVSLLLERGQSRSVRIATDLEERTRLWHARKKAYGALGRISRDLVVQDAVVPRTKLPEVLKEIGRIADHHRVSVSNVFHAGDGNLHPNINYDSDVPGEVERVERAASEIMKLCVAAGGTLTGEHGIGSDKMRYMSHLFDPDSLTAMNELRRAFDPIGIANPGKVVPTHSCSEWRPHTQ